ncbi:hypothetical protein SLEP1_g8658 [Rubroshorea leprosula]|uniref:AT-hook motif nuclear-localized protein n=1 Tax=Rubroshorea leprosula TaxID=152421 RepID=A0AAV5IC86_9ROSI|nr:hypothetical protein SLEP1_g8658 [Rubroshorea leprosula]
MDGREAMALTGGSTPYYIHRGGVGGSGSASATHSGAAAYHGAPAFRSLTNPQLQAQSNVGSPFSVEPNSASATFPHGINMGVSSGVPSSEPVKKKRGRPRKYAPEGQVSLGLLPMPTKSKPSSESDTSGQKRGRGRPPGSGRKQQLSLLGEWMNNSAGLAFSPHVITIGVGEDIVSKMLSFAQQRPRAVCILSGSGTVSSVTLRQPASTTPTVTYEVCLAVVITSKVEGSKMMDVEIIEEWGFFEILCLSGSYLVSEDEGPRGRTGGISVSLSTPDGHVMGGGVANLIAASPVQLIVCSFVYGGSKSKNKQLASPKENKDSALQASNKSATPSSAPPTQHYNPAAMSAWPGSRPVDLRTPHTDIDLMRG